MKLRVAILAATVLVAPGAAMAQAIDGLYVGGGLGFNYLQDTKAKNVAVPNGSPAFNTGKLTSNGGFVGLASIGYGLGNGLRVELEGNYREDHTRLKHNSAYTGGANVQQYGPMVNVLYDITEFDLPVTPYVGAGAGYIFRNLQSASFYTPGQTTSVAIKNEAKGAFAGQAIVCAFRPIVIAVSGRS
jgi:outer membrane protein W